MFKGQNEKSLFRDQNRKSAVVDIVIISTERSNAKYQRNTPNNGTSRTLSIRQIFPFLQIKTSAMFLDIDIEEIKKRWENYIPYTK